MIIDAHAHVSNTEYGSADVLLEQLAVSNIDISILVPGGMIDVRYMTDYIRGKRQPYSGKVPNDIVVDAMRRFPKKFLGFYCANPLEGRTALEEFEQAAQEGFSGLKLAPIVHQFSFSNSTVKDLVHRCGELGMPVYAHVLFNPGSTTEKFAHLAKEFPTTNFILGHMGFGPADPEAIEWANKLDNLYLETSGGSYIAIQEALRILGPGKLIFGTEFPMHHPQCELQKIEILSRDGAFEKMTQVNIMNLLPPRRKK